MQNDACNSKLLSLKKKVLFYLQYACGLFFSTETNQGLTCNTTLDIHTTDADSVCSLLSVFPTSKLLYMCETLTIWTIKRFIK